MKHSTTFIVALLLTICSAATSVRGASAGSCASSCFLGISSCTANCEQGYHPVCSVGFLSTTCSCEPDNAAETPKQRVIPSLTPQQQMLANEFITWATGSASPALQHLGSLGENSLNAAQQHNVPMFSAVERQFGDALNSLPFPDAQATANWRVQHGLGN